MSKINVLDKSVYNRIAAGEVVERPFSIVKELIENSVDAGATDITVSLTDGGKKCVTVTDNGSGIAADDLIKALMPHATSKISTADDLNRILTLGFRGEALASIAAVSRVTIISKTAGCVNKRSAQETKIAQTVPHGEQAANCHTFLFSL